MTIELRIPKMALPAELALGSGPARRVDLFVGEGQPIAELLEEGPEFFPVRDAERGGCIVNKAAIAWIAVATRDGDDGELFSERRVVRVELTGGESLDGELLYSPAEGRTRVVDQLNEGGRFVRLWSADRVWFVNKQHIARVVEPDKGA